MVKLNIEMTMADLIMKLAKGENSDMNMPSTSHHRTETQEEEEEGGTNGQQNYKMQSVLSTKPAGEDFSSIDDDMGQFDESKAASTRGILDGGIQVETIITSRISRKSRVDEGRNDGSDDELPLSYPVR